MNYKLPALSRRAYIALLSTISVVLFLFLGAHFSSKFYTSDIEINCRPDVPELVDTRVPINIDTNSDLRHAKDQDDAIPNIIHYVWLVEGRPEFLVDFKIFISVYSAYLYFKPDKIYIHTDATAEQFQRAQHSTDDSTRWTLRIPSVTFHHITVPHHTTNCRIIRDIKHRSDFVRTAVLHEYGGIYMDTDIIALRDVKPLRESGFANIMGLEEPGRVNNGFMMCKKGSALISIFRVEQHRIFDNRWTTHSVNLLSELSYRLQPVPNEVLVLGLKVFSPSSWTKKDINTLFKAHSSTPVEPPKGNNSSMKVPTTFDDAVGYWERRKDTEGKEKWEVDYSGSYVIHAFDGTPERYWPRQVSLDYVLERRSNYARAVYPAIRHAIDSGLIDRKEK